MVNDLNWHISAILGSDSRARRMTVNVEMGTAPSPLVLHGRSLHMQQEGNRF